MPFGFSVGVDRQVGASLSAHSSFFAETTVFEGSLSRPQVVELADSDDDQDLDAIAVRGKLVVVFHNDGAAKFGPITPTGEKFADDIRTLLIEGLNEDADLDVVVGDRRKCTVDVEVALELCQRHNLLTPVLSGPSNRLSW